MPALIRTAILHSPEPDPGAGETLRGLLGAANGTARFVVVQESSVGHDRNWCEEVLCRWCDEEEVDLILTVGGTFPAAGPDRREIVPEATAVILDRVLPGLPEAMRAHAGELTELALLDRGTAGIRSRTLLVNLPGGSGPAALFLEAILHLLAPIVAHLNGEADAPRLQDEVEVVRATDSGEQAAQTLGADAATDNVVDDAADAGADARQAVEPHPSDDASRQSKLNADEFAAFLRRPRK